MSFLPRVANTRSFSDKEKDLIQKHIGHPEGLNVYPDQLKVLDDFITYLIIFRHYCIDAHKRRLSTGSEIKSGDLVYTNEKVLRAEFDSFIKGWCKHES